MTDAPAVRIFPMDPRIADAYRDAYVKLQTGGSYATAVPSSLDVLAALHHVGEEATRQNVIDRCVVMKLALADFAETERPASTLPRK